MNYNIHMEELVNILILFIQNLGPYGVILSSIVILFESIFPVIPLFVFITINYEALGSVLGFFISWTFTIAGCIMSYYLFRNGLGNRFERLTENKELIKKYTNMFKNISTGKLLLIIAFPFTPAFAVNIAAGLAKMDFKKYLTALIFGKISLVIYSAYLGLSLLESLTNPIALLKMIVVIGSVYLLYIICKKIFKFD